MMRYRTDPLFERLELTIRSAVKMYGLEARLAKDVAYEDDVWHNIIHYMKHCKYGIAVFEEINEREFNPNVSMELGYMYGLKRRCLVLKDRRMPRLPTDICGKIYKDFDTYNVGESVSKCVQTWCQNDLGIAAVDPMMRRTALDHEIEASIESFGFEKRDSWPSHVSLVVKDELENEKVYIVWNEEKRKLFKWYREYGLARTWDGPFPLTETDEKRVREHLELK